MPNLTRNNVLLVSLIALLCMRRAGIALRLAVHQGLLYAQVVGCSGEGRF